MTDFLNVSKNSTHGSRQNRRNFLNQLSSLSVATFAMQVHPVLVAGSELPTGDSDGKSKRLNAGAKEQDGFAFELNFPAMGSLLSIKYLDTNSTRVEEAKARAADLNLRCRELVDRWDATLSDYDDESEASQIAVQADSGDWVTVTPQLGAMLDACDFWHQLSLGAFDASLGAVTRLRRRRRVPAQSAWEKAHTSTGWNKLVWDSTNSRLKFHTPGIRFDFGAIGKGWVVDKIFDLLSVQELPCCCVNFSGNMRAGISPPESSGWPIAVDACTSDFQSPTIPLLHLRLQNESISTSGNRWQTYPDKRSQSLEIKSSHIVDPTNNLGLDGSQNVTVIAKSACDADAASTATSIHLTRDLSRWIRHLEQTKTDIKILAQYVKNNELHLTSTLM